MQITKTQIAVGHGVPGSPSGPGAHLDGFSAPRCCGIGEKFRDTAVAGWALGGPAA